MYKRIWNWFMETFPGVQHSVNYDSAVPAVSAWYFSVSKLRTEGPHGREMASHSDELT